MNVVWTEQFWIELAHELDVEGRPTFEHFEAQLRVAVEMAFSLFWDDPGRVLEAGNGIFITSTVPVGPFMFPPGTFYANQLDDATVAIIGVDFDWDYWSLVDDGGDD